VHTSDTELPAIGIIGATGRIGRAVAALLASTGGRFRVIARDPVRAARRLGPHADVIAGDCREPVAIARALDGCERVLITCSEPSSEPGLIDALVAGGSVRRVVKISAAGTGDEAAPSHQDAERALSSSGLGWTLLRPTFLVQSLAEIIPATLDGDLVRVPAGDAAVSFVDARDVAAVALHALLERGHEGCTWTITGPCTLTMHDVVRAVSRAVGRELRYAPADPPCAAYETALGARAEQVVLARQGALGIVTDVVHRIGRVEPRSALRFIATHDWDVPAAAIVTHSH
jgi:uncharacterized protein YbjT (DUF2867 family)